MDRRRFLKSIGAGAWVVGAPALAPALAAGCSREPERNLNVVVATIEVLTGESQRVPFGLRDLETNEEVQGADVEVFLENTERERVGGPFPATYTDPSGTGLGIYAARVDVAEPGTFFLVAVAGNRKGEAPINVVTPEQSAIVAPGDEAVSTPTPTAERPLGFQEVCTLDPPCGMHERSLDDALAAGEPVALLFATPAYCQTAVCGPAVTIVDEVRQGQEWGDVRWIHVEIFTDEGQTIAPPVEAWELPSEPWLFTIGSDGVVAGRLDGPMSHDIVAEMAREISA